MKKIWQEVVCLAKGHDAARILRARAWWDKGTGTLRAEMMVRDEYRDGYDNEIDHQLVFSTNPTREAATRDVIALMDSLITRHKPEAQRIAALSYECEGWRRALHGHEVEPV